MSDMTILAIWLASGFASALLARAAWQLEFGRKPLTIGDVVVAAVCSIAGPVPLIVAAVWFSLWVLHSTRLGSAVKRWMQKPLFRRAALAGKGE